MKIRVIDFESTGLPDKDPDVRLVEIGMTDLHDNWRVSRTTHALVNPGIPMPAEARGVHHLSDQDVEGGLSQAEARELLLFGMEPGDMFAAHNYKMESALFDAGPFPWICTMICAKHLWPAAPGFANQTLRYHLGIDSEFEWPDLAMPPHRAGPDSYVTAHILSRLVFAASPTKLVELTRTPILLKYVESGKYEGRLWSEMDRGYLEFILNPTKGPFKQEVLDTARYWLDQLNKAGNPFS